MFFFKVLFNGNLRAAYFFKYYIISSPSSEQETRLDVFLTTERRLKDFWFNFFNSANIRSYGKTFKILTNSYNIISDNGVNRDICYVNRKIGTDVTMYLTSVDNKNIKWVTCVSVMFIVGVH